MPRERRELVKPVRLELDAAQLREVTSAIRLTGGGSVLRWVMAAADSAIATPRNDLPEPADIVTRKGIFLEFPSAFLERLDRHCRSVRTYRTRFLRQAVALALGATVRR
jgi:hypothetical protein